MQSHFEREQLDMKVTVLDMVSTLRMAAASAVAVAVAAEAGAAAGGAAAV